jgi:phage shock protein PspC (stress-responsive transcriptional regulator)
MTAETDGGPYAQPTGPTQGARQTTPLHRSPTDRVFAGVCGGIAETYGADPTAVRLLAAIIAIFTGIVPMVVLYLVAAVVIPESTEAAGSPGPMTRSRIDGGQIGLILGAVLVIGGLAALANEFLLVEWEVIWPVLLIGIGALMVVVALRREHD